MPISGIYDPFSPPPIPNEPIGSPKKTNNSIPPSHLKEQRAPPISLKKRQVITTDKELEHNLEALLKKYEIEIGDKIFRLERGSEPQEPPSAVPSHKRSKQINFLKNLFPEQILQNPYIKGRFNLGHIKIALGEALIRASDSGLKFLTIFYKGKIIEEAHGIMREIKSLYKNNQEMIPLEIREWETHLKKEGSLIQADYIKFGFKVVEKGTSLSHGILKFVPLTGFFERWSPSILTNLGNIGTILGFVLAGLELKETVHISNSYTAWVDKFKIWREKTGLGGVIKSLKKGEGLTRPVSVRDFIKSISRSDKTYTQHEFHTLIKETNGIEQIRLVLKKIDVHLDASIHTKEQFLALMDKHPDFRNKVVDQYILYQEITHTLNHIIETSQSLVEKREALAEKKALQLSPEFEKLKPELFKLNRTRFEIAFENLFEDLANPKVDVKRIRTLLLDKGLALQGETKKEIHDHLMKIKDNPLEYSLMYKKWFSVQSKSDLFKPYIDFQETLEITTKNALKEIVSQKHTLEGKFNKFKLTISSTLFALVTATLIVTAVVGILALVSNPFGAAALLLIALTVAVNVFNWGSMAAGYYMSKKYRPSGIVFFEALSLKYKETYAQIKQYQLLSKQKKLVEMAKLISQMIPESRNKEYPKALKDYKQLELELKHSFTEAEKWNQKIISIENKLADRAWGDFIKVAGLPSSKEDLQLFDTLQAFQEAFNKSNFSLFDKNTKQFFEEQLGINLDRMQVEMKKNPDALTYALKHFINLDETRFHHFIKHQELYK